MKPKHEAIIMKKIPDPSDEEIRSHMNFDQLLTHHTLRQKKITRLKRAGRWAGLAIAAVTLTVLWWSHSRPDPTLKAQVHPSEQTGAPEPDNEDALPAQKLPDPAVKETAQSRKLEPKVDKPSLQEPSPIHAPVLTEAEPVNGFPALYEYFDMNLQYPQASLKDSVEGVVTVSFIIDEAGMPANIMITQSLGPAFDEESRRVIRQMPAWKPATIDGRAVSSRMSMPLTFRLQKK